MEQNIEIKFNEKIQKMSVEQAVEIIKERMSQFYKKNSNIFMQEP